MYLNGTGNIGFASAGTTRAQISSSKLTVLGGTGIDLQTSSGNVRGLLASTEAVPHLRIATSSNESIGFFDGGTSGTENVRIEGAGHVDLKTGNLKINGTTVINTSRQLVNLTFYGDTTGVRFAIDIDLVDTGNVKRLRFNSSGSSVYNSTNGHVFQHAGVNKADIQTDGDAIFAGNVTAYGSPSDINLKENIETIPNAVEKVQKLDGITFNYKKDGGRSTGLIAQQLQEVLPEVVYTAKDLEGEEHLAVRYGNVVGLLVEALKEQQTQINNLTSLVNQLKEK